MSATFREVDVEELCELDEPHYCRTPAFVAWVAGPALAGAFPTSAQQVGDLDLAQALSRRAFRPPGRMLYSDVRGFGESPAVLDDLLRRGPLQPPEVLPTRTAVIVPNHWSTAWWVGSLAMGAFHHTPARAFTDPAAAWAWLGAPPNLFTAVEQLTAAYRTEVGALISTQALTDQLRADPSLTLEAAARALGSSTRSLQRALHARGESFAQLRDRARVEIASARLAESDDKIDSVAADTGFRSRSHFIAWFRRMTGMSPAAFRDHHRAARSHSA